MTLKQYFGWMMLSTLLCWLGWLSVIWTVDPSKAGFLGIFLFYAALSLSLLGTFSVAGLGVRVILSKHEPLTRHAATSFRQGVLLTILLTVSLALNSKSILTWWNLLIFCSTMTVLEFFLISYKSHRQP